MYPHVSGPMQMGLAKIMTDYNIMLRKAMHLLLNIVEDLHQQRAMQTWSFGMRHQVMYTMDLVWFCINDDAIRVNLMRKHHAAYVIQRAWMEATQNPAYALCKRLRLRDFEAMGKCHSGT